MSLRHLVPPTKQPLNPLEGTAESLRRVDRAMRRIGVEPALPAESSRYEDMLVNTPIGMYRVDRTGQLLDGNPALVRMLGRPSLEDLLSENGAGPFSNPTRGRFWFRLRREMEIAGFESQWLRSDGSRVYLRENARAVRGPDGEVICYEGTLEDISDRRAAEKQLQKERDFSSAVIDTAGSPVLILDLEGRIVRFNQACEALSGYSFHDVAGKPVWEAFTAPEEQERSRQYFQNLVSGAFPCKHESRWLSSTGETRHIAWSDSAILDEKGAICNIIAMGVDITDRKAAEDALRDSESRYRELFESASDIVFRLGLDGSILSINEAATRLTGYDRDAIGNIAQVLGTEALQLTRSKIAAKLAGAADTQYEVKLQAANGTEVYLDVKTTLSRENGKPCEVLGIGRDITWRKRSEQFERGRREILEMATQHEPLSAVMQKLARLVEAQFAQAMCSIDVTASLAGQAPRAPEISRAPSYQLLSPETPEYCSGHRIKWRIPVLTSDHRQLAVITLLLVRTEPPTAQESEILGNEVRLAILTIQHYLMTDRMQWNAQHDKLTGLANCDLFEERVRMAIATRQSDHHPLAIFLVDLDRFKLVNDALGHETGDMLVKGVAQRLSAAVAGRGLVARMGADDFMVMADPISTRDDADSLGRELLSCFATPFECDAQELFITASIGCSIHPWDGEDVQTLRRNADTALNRAKNSGHNRCIQFAPVMTSGLDRRLKVQNELHRALDRGELQIFYQPQHDLKNDRMIGVEALLRWTSRNLGVVGPAEFIPIAEESGLIIEIGTWVLREACRQCRSWLDLGHRLRIAVNVSAWQFDRPDFVEIVHQALTESGIPADLLELELTETVLMREPAETTAGLDRLRAMGVLISIDDFGTGYSSLAYLQRLPIQSLKIDLSFVRAIAESKGESEQVPPLIRAITAVAQGLNISVIAEGVEKEYQARVLRRAGCDRVQGYLYGRPASAADVTSLLATDCRPSQMAARASSGATQ